jgi:outer membrane protein assembly factor BamB
MKLRFGSILLAAALAAAPVLANDWYQWRGPEQNGVSRETGLVDSWDPDSGENVVWTKPGVGGMSSPVVMNGKLYTLTRIGDVPEGGNVRAGEQTQEAIVCLDAATGNVLWQHAENMFQTDLPFHRLGWSNVVADPKSKRVYAYHAAGMLVARDAETGQEVWRRSMSEEFGMISTFGGRTSSPAIDDEDQLYIGGVAFGWGDHARSQYRVFCFDRNTGELRWSQGSGGIPVDAPYNTPVISVIGGQKLCVIGCGDGSVSAFQARTGKKVWSHQVSKRGLNASVVVEGNVVYACSSEENLTDTSLMGTVVAIDAGGEKPKELWRADGQEVGFSSPTIGDGSLFVMTNSGRVVALDLNTGAQRWKKSAGTIGKASLVYADGKLFVPEANHRMTILKPAGDKAEVLSKVEISEDKLGREYGIFGSVAVADGRIYLPTSNTMICIGKKGAKAEPKPVPVPEAKKEEPAAEDAEVAFVQVLPFDVVTRPGHQVKLRARTFDGKGRLISDDVKDAAWSIGTLEFEAPPKALPIPVKQGEASPGEGGKPTASAPAATPSAPAAPPRPVKIQIGNLKGDVKDGTFTAGDGLLGGGVYARVGDVTGQSRVRVVPPLPWNMGFTNAATDRPPITWIGAGGKFEVQEKAGEKLITKLTNIDLYARARTYFGSADMKAYTIQADVMADEKLLGKREEPAADAGGAAAPPAAADAVVKAAEPVSGAGSASTDAARTAAEKSAEEKPTAGEESTLQSKPAGRKFIPDVGIINSRYVLMLTGNEKPEYQKLTLHAWPSELPHSTNKTVQFLWQPHKWYTMKLKVTPKGKTSLLQGKVWLKGEPEPDRWTVELEDRQPNTNGAPGIFGNSGVTPGKALIYWDNIRVTGNE